VDHEHNSLDFLERSTVLEDEWSKVLRSLISHRNIHEVVFLSTCLRTEVVAVVDRFHGAIEEITATLAQVTGLDVREFEDRLTIHFDSGVATHLFSVAAGLKSVIPGEFEILGQLRRALELASDEQTAGSDLTELFRRAISSGRRVRSETSIARGTTSFAQAAVSMALEELGDEIDQAEVVVVGAGQLATGVVKSLLDTSQRLGRLTIVNRTTSKAHLLRDEVGDERVEIGSFDKISSDLGPPDSCSCGRGSDTGAREDTLRCEHCADTRRRSGPSPCRRERRRGTGARASRGYQRSSTARRARSRRTQWRSRRGATDRLRRRGKVHGGPARAGRGGDRERVA